CGSVGSPHQLVIRRSHCREPPRSSPFAFGIVTAPLNLRLADGLPGASSIRRLRRLGGCPRAHLRELIGQFCYNSGSHLTRWEGFMQVATVPPTVSLDDPAHYINRELSWLEFNRRVLEEAQDPQVALLERLNFVTVVSSNLDEL